MNILSAFNPLEMAGKALGGLGKVMEGAMEALTGAAQCLKKLMSGDLLGAMGEFKEMTSGAMKCMQGMEGMVPGLKMDPKELLGSLLGGEKNGQEGTNPLGMLLDMLPPNPLSMMMR